MADDKNEKVISGVLIEESQLLTLEEFCLAIQSEKTTIIKMIEFQLIQPQGESPDQWRFDSFSLKRGRIAMSFYRDLEINMSGIALALDLLEKIDSLEHQVNLLQRFSKDLL